MQALESTTLSTMKKMVAIGACDPDDHRQQWRFLEFKVSYGKGRLVGLLLLDGVDARVVDDALVLAGDLLEEKKEQLEGDDNHELGPEQMRLGHATSHDVGPPEEEEGSKHFD